MRQEQHASSIAIDTFSKSGLVPWKERPKHNLCCSENILLRHAPQHISLMRHHHSWHFLLSILAEAPDHSSSLAQQRSSITMSTRNWRLSFLRRPFRKLFRPSKPQHTTMCRRVPSTRSFCVRSRADSFLDDTRSSSDFSLQTAQSYLPSVASSELVDPFADPHYSEVPLVASKSLWSPIEQIRGHGKEDDAAAEEPHNQSLLKAHCKASELADPFADPHNSEMPLIPSAHYRTLTKNEDKRKRPPINNSHKNLFSKTASPSNTNTDESALTLCGALTPTDLGLDEVLADDLLTPLERARLFRQLVMLSMGIPLKDDWFHLKYQRIGPITSQAPTQSPRMLSRPQPLKKRWALAKRSMSVVGRKRRQDADHF